MVERTVLAQDIQSILRQNDKILDLNKEIFKFVSKVGNHLTINDFGSIESMKSAKLDSALKNAIGT